MILTKEEAQLQFVIDFDKVLDSTPEELNYIEQNHYGNFLLEETEDGNNKFHLWANYDGEAITGIEVEHFGPINGYKWETVYIE